MKNINQSLVVDFDMYDDPRFAKDIHEGLDMLRRDAPGVFFTPRNGGHWVILDSSAIDHVMRTPEIFSSRCMTIPNRADQPRLIPVSLDPPEHFLYRRLLMNYFEPRAIRQLEGRISFWTETLIAEIREQRQCDFVSAISSRLPIYVFMELVGLPLERHVEFRGLAHQYIALSGDPEKGEVIANQILAILTDHIESRIKAPQEDIISKLITADLKGRPLALDELQSIAFLLFIAGLDTVTNAMTFGMRYLARDRSLQTRLRKQPDLIPSAMDELLRRFAFANVPRLVVQDTTLNGAPLSAGDVVFVMLPMLGLDPNINPDPNHVNIDRTGGKHVAFGTGAHVCLGRNLARLELQSLYRSWLAHIPDFEIDDQKPSPPPRAAFAMSLPELQLRW
jgi:cytochrome P450